MSRQLVVICCCLLFPVLLISQAFFGLMLDVAIPSVLVFNGRLIASSPLPILIRRKSRSFQQIHQGKVEVPWKSSKKRFPNHPNFPKRISQKKCLMARSCCAVSGSDPEWWGELLAVVSLYQNGSIPIKSYKYHLLGGWTSINPS